MARTTWNLISFALARHPQGGGKEKEMIQEKAASMSTTNPSFPLPKKEQQRMKLMQPDTADGDQGNLGCPSQVPGNRQRSPSRAVPRTDRAA